jgi:hypothetical protein
MTLVTWSYVEDPITTFFLMKYIFPLEIHHQVREVYIFVCVAATQ